MAPALCATPAVHNTRCAQHQQGERYRSLPLPTRQETYLSLIAVRRRFISSRGGALGALFFWLRVRRGLAWALAPRGIRVNAVCPGWVRTDSSLRSLKSMAAEAGRTEDAMLGDILPGQPIARLLEPADIAEIFCFLASDDANSITGQSIVAGNGEVTKELEIPAGRFGRPEEVAATALFLATDPAAYYHGRMPGPNGDV